MATLLAVATVGVARSTSAPDQPAAQDRENALLKKEIELLRKENELLKKELEQLKAQAPAAGEKRVGAKVTLDNVEYEFASLKMNGNEGELRVLITSKKGGHQILGQLPIRMLQADGTEHKTPVPTTTGPIRLLEGVKTEVTFKAGKVPSDAKSFATIILPGVGGKGFVKAQENPVILKGEFKVER